MSLVGEKFLLDSSGLKDEKEIGEFFPVERFNLFYNFLSLLLIWFGLRIFLLRGDLFVGSWLPVKTRAQIKQGKTGFVWEKVPGKSRPGCRE